MADEVVEASSPVVTTPEVLDGEALKPASSIFDAIAQADSNKKTQELVAPPRPRGRPKGSTNRPKEESLQERLERIKKAKDAKVDEYVKMFTDDINEQIMAGLITLGVPPEALYKEGRVPQTVQVNPAYTPIANALAIKPTQARNVSRFLVELQWTDAGQRMQQRATSGKAPLVYSGIMAGISLITYANGLNQTMKRFAPFIAAARQAKKDEDNNNDAGT